MYFYRWYCLDQYTRTQCHIARIYSVIDLSQETTHSIQTRQQIYSHKIHHFIPPILNFEYLSSIYIKTVKI